jgi:NADH-quinone oxidoreductase subunit C
MSQRVLDKAADLLGDKVIEKKSAHGDEVLIVHASHIVEVLRTLRDHPETSLDFLTDLTCVDWLGLSYEPRFEIVYQLRSMKTGERLRVKAPLAEPQDGSHPVIDTICPLWACANWCEREVWDLYGIKFAGHPDLRRILMYEEFKGHPMRKDYPKEKRQPLVRRDFTEKF